MVKGQQNNKVVYIHRNPETKVPFYCGIGKPDRPYNFIDRSEFWKRYYRKYGVEVQILLTGLTWTQACVAEEAIIALIGRRDLGTGTLVNLTSGGEKGGTNTQPGSGHMYYGKKRPEFAEKVRGQKRPEVSEKLKYGSNGKALLTYEAVQVIKSQYEKEIQVKKQGAVQKIADKFNVSYTCIYDICVRKRTWNY